MIDVKETLSSAGERMDIIRIYYYTINLQRINSMMLMYSNILQMLIRLNNLYHIANQ